MRFVLNLFASSIFASLEAKKRSLLSVSDDLIGPVFELKVVALCARFPKSLRFCLLFLFVRFGWLDLWRNAVVSGMGFAYSLGIVLGEVHGGEE